MVKALIAIVVLIAIFFTVIFIIALIKTIKEFRTTSVNAEGTSAFKGDLAMKVTRRKQQ
jgi:hypothetical protein